MKEWYSKWRAHVSTFVREYGKVFLTLTSLLLFGVMLTLLVLQTTQKGLRVTFFDVGQGDAIFVETPSGHDMLIDGGASNLVVSRLASRLSYFDKHLDVVVATHPDSDHITGLIPVFDRYDVEHVVVSPVKGHTDVSEELMTRVENEHADVHVGHARDVIDFGDGVVAHIRYPGDNFHGNEKDTNNASVSVVLTYGNESVLLTGDLPSQYEGKLIDDDLPSHVTIYKAGHHGSKYSSGDQLLSYIKPEYSVISAGKDNRYGHPNPEAVGRLKTYSNEILSTIEKGSITFLLDGSTVKLDTTK